MSPGVFCFFFILLCMSQNWKKINKEDCCFQHHSALLLSLQSSLLTGWKPRFLYFLTTSSSSPRMESVFHMNLFHPKISHILCFVHIQDQMIVSSPYHTAVLQLSLFNFLSSSDLRYNCQVIWIFLSYFFLSFSLKICVILA